MNREELFWLSSHVGKARVRVELLPCLSIYYVPVNKYHVSGIFEHVFLLVILLSSCVKSVNYCSSGRKKNHLE